MARSIRVVLLGCVNKKHHPRSHVPAQDLYKSDLWSLRRKYAEATGQRWLILSAKHGAIEPTTHIGHYNVRISKPGTPKAKAWAKKVLKGLDEILGEPRAAVTLEIHAGVDYVQPLLTALAPLGPDQRYNIDLPLRTSHTWAGKRRAGMGMGIGHQKSWYARAGAARASVLKQMWPQGETSPRTRFIPPAIKNLLGRQQGDVLKLDKPEKMTFVEFVAQGLSRTVQSVDQSFEDWLKMKRLSTKGMATEFEEATYLGEVVFPTQRTSREVGKHDALEKRVMRRWDLRKRWSREVTTTPVTFQIDLGKKADIAHARCQHKRAIRRALRAGFQVPQKVLAEYPDMKKGKVAPPGETLVAQLAVETILMPTLARMRFLAGEFDRAGLAVQIGHIWGRAAHLQGGQNAKKAKWERQFRALHEIPSEISVWINRPVKFRHNPFFNLGFIHLRLVVAPVGPAPGAGKHERGPDQWRPAMPEECNEDVEKIAAYLGQPVSAYAVSMANLDKSLRGDRKLKRPGCGRLLYAYAALLAASYGGVLIADECDGGATSIKARKIYTSGWLKTHCLISGQVVWGGAWPERIDRHAVPSVEQGVVSGNE